MEQNSKKISSTNFRGIIIPNGKWKMGNQLKVPRKKGPYFKYNIIKE